LIKRETTFENFAKIQKQMHYIVILLMGFYGKLATMLSKPALFRTTICFFLGFSLILGYLVLPNTQLLHASPEWIDAMAIAYPNIGNGFFFVCGF
jgi:ATP/ADP translocase